MLTLQIQKELWRQNCLTIVSFLPKILILYWTQSISIQDQGRFCFTTYKNIFLRQGGKGPTWWFYSRTLRPCRRVGAWGLSGSTGSAPWSQEATGSQSLDTGSLKQEYTVMGFMYKLYRHKLYREQIVSAQIVSAQFVSDTNYIGHKLYRTQIVSGTNCIGHKLYRASYLVNSSYRCIVHR